MKFNSPRAYIFPGKFNSAFSELGYTRICWDFTNGGSFHARRRGFRFRNFPTEKMYHLSLEIFQKKGYFNCIVKLKKEHDVDFEFKNVEQLFFNLHYFAY